MHAMDFDTFFTTATGFSRPFPYQRRLAESAWPDLLDVPTGLGKSAAIILGWLYKRQVLADPETPRRLVYCLPMRVLVEQTASNARTWLEHLDRLGPPGAGRVSVHVLMGGEPDLGSWAEWPEEDVILVGTQDMLLSRALMRGYGMSRYQWPVHFALLHNDALWVFDEVQLMGPGIATSSQIEGLRRTLGTARRCRSLWASATLRPDWLASIDMHQHMASLRAARLEADDRADPGVAKRLHAPKALHRAPVVLDSQSGRQRARGYIDALAAEILAAHGAGEQSLVIVNRVERAQRLYDAIGKRAPALPRLLLHARFRPAERRSIEERLRSSPGAEGRVVIATQAVEAGVDVSSRVLFTELAPWTSLVQRFGRCNRSGEHADSRVYWIDIDDEANEAAPYDAPDLASTRALLAGDLADVGPGRLPAVTETPTPSHVLRRRDLLELFNTDPDLAGFDVDVAMYIRDASTPQCQVFWRSFTGRPDSAEPAPVRDELCPAGLAQVRDHLARAKRTAWTWDPLSGAWQQVPGERLRPGMTILLRAEEGGYSPELGFLAHSRSGVESLASPRPPSEQIDSEPWTHCGRFVSLTEHLGDVRDEALALADRLHVPEDERAALGEAGLWHDVGKAHPAFQTALRDFADDRSTASETLWAKSPSGIDARNRPLRFRIERNGVTDHRRGFRHELASALAWLEHGTRDEHHDLIAYLVAAHHGKVRLGLRAAPNEPEPPEPGRPFARGVWDGDEIPAVTLNGRNLPPTTLHLDVISLGEGPRGPSWSARTRALLHALGPFRLAWLESLLRIADARASRREANTGRDSVS